MPSWSDRSRNCELLANRKGAVRSWRVAHESIYAYLTWNTIFDNTRVVSELRRKPVPFSQYSYPLLKFSRENNFSYIYKPWPRTAGGSAA